MSYKIIKGDIQEFLDTYEGERFHGVLCDPPYALISISKRFGGDNAPAQEGSDGRYSRLSKGFMGQSWDGFKDYDEYEDWIAKWAKTLIEKALYPGAVCMFFGGTRTYHRLARGLERGGFEILDCLMWFYGSGFPKSHDISKGIDKAAGAEREIIGKSLDTANRKKTTFHGAEYKKGWTTNPEGERLITAPATEAAQEWDGYGTALKPAWEPIVLCRTPRGSMTFAELAKTYGTGALWIDGGRVGTDGGTTRRDGSNAGKARNTLHGGNFGVDDIGKGRWPANLLLTHHEDCVKIGEFEVEGRTINKWKEGMKPFGDAGRQQPPWFYLADDERHLKARAEFEAAGGSLEDFKGGKYESEKFPPDIVERYACVAECPVRQLDDSTINRGFHASGQTEVKRYGNDALTTAFPIPRGLSRGYGKEVGNPSRFFYSGKASRSEKDKGLEAFFWKRTSEGFEQVSEAEYNKLVRKDRAKGNIHPTVKPLDLLRYLATLSKPPDSIKSRLLVPFSGSGSEIIGALQSGWKEVVGVELEENYCEIAEQRINSNLGMFT